MEAKHLDANVQSPDSIAFAPDDTLYVADTGNHVIRAVDLATGRIRHVAGDGREGKASRWPNRSRCYVRQMVP